VDKDLAADLAFVGTGFESRIEFFEAMDLDGLDVLLAGNWQRLTEDSPLRKYVAHDIKECLDNADGVRIYQSAKLGLNLYRREAEDGDSHAGWACGPREIEMAACGLAFIRDPRPEGDELFPMLPTFSSPKEASDLVRWLLEHPDQRDEAARNARAAIADRTFSNHAARLLTWLDA
jgi:spore maturation protein CgeB